MLSHLYGHHVDVLRGARARDRGRRHRARRAHVARDSQTRARARSRSSLSATCITCSGRSSSPASSLAPRCELAAAVGAVVAIVAGCVGVFTVIRGQSFAGEALGDLGAAGGSSCLPGRASTRCGDSSAVTVAAAGMMELIGIQRARGRDLATGIVLGAGFGLAALFLYLGTIYDNTTGATVTVLFGSTVHALKLGAAARRGLRRAGAGDRGCALPAAAAGVGEPRPGRRARRSGCG